LTHRSNLAHTRTAVSTASNSPGSHAEEGETQMEHESPHRIGHMASALLGCFIAAGSAQAQHQPPTSNPVQCNPGNCTITVTVNDCQRDGGITVSPDFVMVTSARNMRWQIVPEGYVFTTDGIQIDPPDSQFVTRNSPKPNEFHIFNRKLQAGDFYYFVNVKEVNGGDCRQVDPYIRNTN